MARIWTIWFWLLEPDKHSCFPYLVNIYLTNVSSSPPQSVMLGWGAIWERGRCVSLHTSWNCAVPSLYTCIGGSCGGKHICLPCWGGLVHFDEAQAGSSALLSPIRASDSNLPVSFPQYPSQLYGPGLYHRSQKWSQTGLFLPAFFVRGRAVSALAQSSENMCVS